MLRDRASPRYPTEGPHFRYRSNPAADEGWPSRHVLDGEGDLCSLLQHGGNGAVLFFREPDRVFHGFLRHLSTNEIGQVNRCIDGGVAVRSFGLCPHFESGERLAFFAENSHYVRRRATAQSEQH